MKEYLLKRVAVYLATLLLFFLLLGNKNVHAQLVAITGQYTGTGNNNNSIVGLGFRPDIVLINSGAYNAQLTTSTFPVNATKDLNGGSLNAGLIRSLDLDGFTVDAGHKVNKAGTEFFFLALKAEPGVIEMGSYIGDNNDNRYIYGTSFQPEMVIVISENNSQKPVYSSVTMGIDNSMNFQNSGFLSDRIQSFDSNGFQVGKNKAVNESGIIYHFIAFRNVAGKVSIGSYTGDGSSNRIIPEPGLGSFVIVKRDGNNATHRNRDMPLNSAYYFKNSSSVSNRIIRNTSSGFELGNNNEVNEPGKEYHFLKLIGLSSILPVQLISFDAGIRQNKVELKWQTAPADNALIADYEIERSDDRVSFKSLVKVAGKYNNNDPADYFYEDINPLPGFSFYRLKITCRNGKTAYSEIKSIFLRGNQENIFTVYPNPLRGSRLNITQTNPYADIHIDIVDVNGTIKDTCILLKGTSWISFKNDLPAGIYYLIGNDGRAVVFRTRLLKF